MPAFAVSLTTLVAVPALWYATRPGVPDANAGSLAGLGDVVDERAELRQLSARQASRSRPPEIRVRSARISGVRVAPRPRPRALAVPALDIRAPVVPVGVDKDQVEIPEDARTVGWYRHGSSPGQPGSAVLVGHVDYDGTRGVFYRLRELEPGAVVRVGFSGRERRFRVVARRSFPKGRLPARLVFAKRGRPYLTLVTCGGDYDRSAREYASNVVVFAVPARAAKARS
ncbi:MAG: class F sortase [Gaiellaceae bacterium]